MPTVNVKFKYGPNGKIPNVGSSTSVQVTRKPPTESEVMVQFKELHPTCDIVIVEIK